MNEVNFNEKINIVGNNILNKVYAQLVRESRNDNYTEDNEIKWETYGLIMSELKDECNYNTYDEIKYRITDNENDIKIFKGVLSNKLKNKNDKLNLLINSI